MFSAESFDGRPVCFLVRRASTPFFISSFHPQCNGIFALTHEFTKSGWGHSTEYKIDQFNFVLKICVNAFLKRLDENGISYDFQDGVLEEPSNMRDISSLC